MTEARDKGSVTEMPDGTVKVTLNSAEMELAEQVARESAKRAAQAQYGRTEQDLTVEQWLAIRKEAALKIDPETAEVMWTYAYIVDPYGIYGDDLTDQEKCSGRVWFVRSPGSDVWVWSGDLPEATDRALRARSAR